MENINNHINGITKRIIGWLFLTVGVIVIFWSVYNSWLIFTTSKDAPQIFKPPVSKQCPACDNAGNITTQQEIQKQIEKMVQGQLKDQIKDILPLEYITNIFNLAAWAIFVGILIFAGASVAGLGVKLIKQ